MRPPRRSLKEAIKLDPALTKGRYRHSRGRHIYFIQGRTGGLIKIGSANDPWGRLKELQANCPIRLHLMGVIWEGHAVRERGLHWKFEPLRQHGEWFRPAPELLAHIAEHASDPADPPDLAEAAS